MALNPPVRPPWDTQRWEQELGIQLRRERLAANLTQAEVAQAANISLSAVKNIETGAGSTLRTLIRVVRVLGLQDWLTTLSPDPGVSPLALADAMRGLKPRQRASGARISPDEPASPTRHR